MEKNEILYNVAAARQFCEVLDRNTTRIHETLKEISEEEEKFSKKENMFNEKNFGLMFLIITIISIIPISIFSVFIGFHIEIFVPFIGFVLTYLAKRYYEKKKLPALKKMHEQVLKNKEKKIDSFIELLYSDCEMYDLILFGIPENLKYSLALDFIYESIRQEHVFCLEDAFTYFNNHIEKIKNTNTKEAEELMKEVDAALKIKKTREEIIKRYVHKEQ